MKNYLFAPFNDDDHKIEEFNAVVNALKYVVDAEETHHHESALHGLRVFVGRLESYYDVTISELQADKDRLIKQVSSNRGNSSSTHTHTKEDESGTRDDTCVTCGRFME